VRVLAWALRKSARPAPVELCQEKPSRASNLCSFAAALACEAAGKWPGAERDKIAASLFREFANVNATIRTAISLLVFAPALWGIPARGQGKTGGDFPLAEGTYWVYQGVVRSWVKGSATGKTSHVTWKTSVERAIRRGGLTIAVVKGMPGDLDWSEGDAKPSLSIVVRTQDAKFYLIEDDAARSALHELDNAAYDWSKQLDDDDLFLELPLANGKKFCDADGMKRDDGEYCWVTGPAHEATLAGVKGIQPAKHVAYGVEYRTNPDDMEFDFVPGIGMVTYQYHHHGTTADTELHLVEFHEAEKAK
jgi:hypothetical protein